MRFPSTFLIFLLFLISCSSGGIGYGVLLWSPSPTKIPHGSLVSIKSESRGDKTYTISFNGITTDVDSWRVNFYHLKEEALKASKEVQEVSSLFVESLKEEIPIRSSQSNYSNNNIIYRLSENEIAKVISPPTEEVTVGNLKGRWYEILTQNGYRGYSFDYYLYIFDPQAVSESSETLLSNDPLKAKLNAWANKTWHPLYYSFMTRNRAIVPSRFNNSYGLSFLPHQKMILLTLPEVQLQFSYLTLNSESVNEITFVEPKLKIEEINSQELKVNFNYLGKDYKETFIIFGGDIKALKERQEKQIEKVMSEIQEANIFTSQEFGELILKNDNSYTWSYPESLIKKLPLPIGEEGYFDLDKNMISNLQKSYKAVITLHSEGSEHPESVFLLDYSPNFAQLILVPTNNIEEGVILKEEINGVNLIFSRNSSQN